MGIAGISPWSLVLILVIIALLFGTKRIRNIGQDIGTAMKGFRKGMSESQDEPAEQAEDKSK